MLEPIYFRVINEDLPVFDDITIGAPVVKVDKLKMGMIYVAMEDTGTGYFKLDNNRYCSNSLNQVVVIPVTDIIEVNGRYAVKDDAEVQGMSRKRRVNTNTATGRMIVSLCILFVIMSVFSMVLAWFKNDSTPLDTIVGGYTTLLTLIIGLYIWLEKKDKLVNVKKILNKFGIASDDIDNQISNLDEDDTNSSYIPF